MLLILITSAILLILKFILRSNLEATPQMPSMVEGTKVKPELVESNIYFSIDSTCKKIFSYLQNENKQAFFSIINKDYLNANLNGLETFYNRLKSKSISKYKTIEIYRSSRRIIYKLFC